MRKILAILLAASMMASMAACGGGGVSNATTPTTPGESTPSTDKTPATEPAPAETPEKAEGDAATDDIAKLLATAPDGGQLIIGGMDSYQNDWLGGWTSGAANSAVRTLIGQGQYYDIYTMNRNGEFIINPVVVEDIQSVENDDKTRTWTIKIVNDLVWDDGTPITAKDYVFNQMLYSSKALTELEADATAGIDMIGYEDFNTGKTPNFTGIRLIDDYTYTVTMKAEKRPFHWEDMTATASPLPMSVIAPGVEITDSGTGVAFSDAFTVDLLRKTLLDPDKGYRFHPTPSCGPYTFGGFDTTANQVTLNRNPKFKGTIEGVKPHIEKVIIKVLASDTMMDELRSGAVDAIFGVGGMEKTNAGMDMVDEGIVNNTSCYAYSYNNWKMSCDFGPAQFKNVRKAIMYIFDREEYSKQVNGGYAKVIDGAYGFDQWEYKEASAELDASLTHYTYDLEKAKQLLVEDGWTKNATGGDYVEAPDAVRYKDVDGTLMPLELQIAATESVGTNVLKTLVPPEAAKVGMKLTLPTMDFAVILNNLYREGIDKPVYNGYAISTGFATQPSPWYDYATEPAYLGLYNPNFIDSPELKEITSKMKVIPLDDKEAWLKAWVEYQKVWNDVLPDIPTTSGEQNAFYKPSVKNVNTSGIWQYKFDIPYMYIEK